jgi:hypothetical protein
MSETRIERGIEWFTIPGDRGEDCQCARCGSSCAYLRCWNCDEDGYSAHDCGEDCCCCLYPENNVVCDGCNGTGGSWHCVSGPEWCEANPLPGREHITSTALRAEAWRD